MINLTRKHDIHTFHLLCKLCGFSKSITTIENVAFQQFSGDNEQTKVHTHSWNNDSDNKWHIFPYKTKQILMQNLNLKILHFSLRMKGMSAISCFIERNLTVT